MHIFEVCDIYTSFSTPRAEGARRFFFALKTAPAEAYSEKGVGVFLKKTGTLLKKHPASQWGGLGAERRLLMFRWARPECHSGLLGLGGEQGPQGHEGGVVMLLEFERRNFSVQHQRVHVRLAAEPPRNIAPSQ